MQQVPKKQRRMIRHGRLYLMLAAVVVLAGSLILWQALRSEPARIPQTVSTAGVMKNVSTEEVMRLTVTLDTGETWSASQMLTGVLTVEERDGDPAFDMSESASARMLAEVAVVAWESVLAEQAADYVNDLPELRLNPPQAVVTIEYADGEEITLRIGAQSDAAVEDVFYYMTIDGDERLLSLAKGTAEELMAERARLRPVTQMVIHKARIDRIELAIGRENWLRQRRYGQRLTRRTLGKTLIWQLEGDITAEDAADRWWLLSPVRYPADGEALDSLRTTLAGLVLGIYECAATPENLRAYGFETPCMVMRIHQQAGTTLGEDGNGTVDWPAGEITLTLGGSRSEVVDYLCYESGIYRINHFTMRTLMNMDAVSTLTRYPVLTSLSNLQRLTISEGDTVTTWEVSRTEQVAPNNELVVDSTGAVVYDYAVTRNGEPVDEAAFEAAYSQLLLTTVSGKLPDGWQAAGKPTSRWVFETRTGLVHTLALIPFDALHDAVVVDGSAVFYLYHGLLTLMGAD